MLTIGEFAKLGGVTVRMLRHYDSRGLLSPARTDQSTGYRYYEATQLARLNRLIALKDLGFHLDQVAEVLGERLSATELRGMLRLRRAELTEAVSTAENQLAQVEVRLRLIESEGTMSSSDVVVKPLPALRLAQLSGAADHFAPESISPVIRPLFDRLCAHLDHAGVTPTGPALARYQDTPDGGVLVRAAMPVPARVRDLEGAQIVELPALTQAATLIHHGPMSQVLPSVQALARWVQDNGHQTADHTREATLASPQEPQDWVTELQAPLV